MVFLLGSRLLIKHAAISFGGERSDCASTTLLLQVTNSVVSVTMFIHVVSASPLAVLRQWYILVQGLSTIEISLTGRQDRGFSDGAR